MTHDGEQISIGNKYLIWFSYVFKWCEIWVTPELKLWMSWYTAIPPSLAEKIDLKTVMKTALTLADERKVEVDF